MNDVTEVLCDYFRYFLFLSRPRGASINPQSMARLRFPTILTFGRSIVLHVNYLQKINLKCVGTDLLLTIYRSEKSFVTRRMQRNEKRRSARLAGRDHMRAISPKMQRITRRNSPLNPATTCLSAGSRIPGKRSTSPRAGINNSCHLTNLNAVTNSSHRGHAP